MDIQQSDMLQPQDWSFPVPIAYGPGRLMETGQRCVTLGIANPLIVTDAGSVNLPFIARLQSTLSEAGLNHGLYGDVSPNPRDSDVDAANRAFRQGGHDAVIAIGGGSAMDGGKLICLTVNSGKDLWDFEFERPAPEIPDASVFPKLITIPTTAGTGAETESTAMVTDTAKGMKYCVWHEALKPALALLDPELTLGLPSHLTAWTGADALTHALEAYLVPGFNPLCDGMALEALALISKWLPVAVEHPENLEARAGMLVGSCLAGIGFLKGLGNVHAISHMIGAEFDTQHGLTNAIVLPVVLADNLGRVPDKTALIALVMSLDDQSKESVLRHINYLLDRIGIPQTLGEIGVPGDCVDRIAEKALQDSAAGTNTYVSSLEEMKRLVKTAIESGRQ